MSTTSNLKYEDIPKRFINPSTPKDNGDGLRVNGKDWKIQKDAFRVRTLGVSKKGLYKTRAQERLQEEQYKIRLADLKDEKLNEKKEKVEDLKRRRALKEEKERHERIAAKMSKKKVERLKRKEKRNKMLKER